jgi:sulfatase modifying factor 1
MPQPRTIDHRKSELSMAIETLDSDDPALVGSRQQQPPPGMVWVPEGTFRMGSDGHYPEEAPAHRVTVDGFWVDLTPVTNRAFRKFVNATGYVTFAEIAPDPKDYPGALPHMLKAGSMAPTGDVPLARAAP